MSKIYNRAKVATATAGAGTMTLGAATGAAFCTFAEAGVQNADEVTYLIEEGTDFEVGRGVYASAGPTLTRATVLRSKIGGVAGTAKMNLAGAATVSIVAVAEDTPSWLGALSVWGVAGNAAATPAAIAAGADGAVLRRNGTALGFGTLIAASFADNTIAYSRLAAAATATQADQETATSTAAIVTPGRQHFHPSACKAWGRINVSGGAVTLAAAYNVTSVTDNGVGDYTFNLATAISSTNYAFAPGHMGNQNGLYFPSFIIGSGATCQMRCWTPQGVSNTGVSFHDIAFGSIIIHGDI